MSFGCMAGHVPQEGFETLRFANLWTGAALLVLDGSGARPRYLAQQWTVALDHAAYQAVHDQQFSFCRVFRVAQNIARLDR
jgi:hypothetical protein